MVKAARFVFATLVNGETRKIIGDEIQVKELYDLLADNCSPNEWVVISVEKHQSEENHYHLLIKFNSPIRESALIKLRELLDNWNGSKCNEVKFNIGKYNKSLGYICKDGKYWTFGSGKELEYIPELVSRRKVKTELYESNTSVGVYTSKERLAEHDLITTVNTYMNKKGYMVNTYTRRLMGCTEMEFWENLNKKINIVRLFGVKALQTIEKLIYNPIYYQLPMYTPNLEYVKFADCMWNMCTGEAKSFDECEGIVPVRVYDVPISYDDPVEFLSILNHNKWDVDSFRRIYGNSFKRLDESSRRKFKTLLIHGETTSGKSTVVLPFNDVFRDVIGDPVKDGNFSVSSISHYPFVLAEEFDVFSLGSKLSNEWKLLLEGKEVRTAVKYGSPVTVCAKRVMITSNDSPPASKELDKHGKALLARLSPYEAKIVDIVDVDMMDKILEEVPRILIWATKN